ncbi:MAG: PAS domain-containing protein [Rariglobus sp.]
MFGWIAENRDYLLFALACLALFGALETWLRRREPSGRLPWLVWPTLAALFVAGYFLVQGAGRAESRRIQDFLQGVAPTYAQEVTRMGHAGLTLETKDDDVNYQRIIAATKRWKAVNPVISDVYTFRKLGERVHLIVSSETDYNRDGKFAGPREQRIPIGKEYPQADENMLHALAGQNTFSEEPVHDEWGWWVSAQVPLFDEQGRIEGALGVDYPAEKWIEAISRGRERMMWLLAMPVLILGFATATTGVLRTEVGARRKIETQLRESEARLVTALDSIPFDFWVMGMDRRYVLTNSVSRSHWGDCVGKSLSDLGFPGEVLEMWERHYDRAFAGELIRTEVFQMVEGERRLLHSIMAPVRVGEKVVGILGLNVDLTERFNAEEALRKSEHRFALHVRQTPLAVVEWDTDFCVTAWNPAAEKIFGYTAAEVLGKSAVPLIVVGTPA